MKKEVELGDRVKDRISGVQGIAVGITYWLYGCTRATIQPEEAKDGFPVDTFCVDEPQLEILKKGVISLPKSAKEEKAIDRPHGTRPDSLRKREPQKREGNTR